jgi:hypothetical protein
MTRACSPSHDHHAVEHSHYVQPVVRNYLHDHFLGGDVGDDAGERRAVICVILASDGAKRKWVRIKRLKKKPLAHLRCGGRGIASEFSSPLLQLWSLYLERPPKMISSAVWGSLVLHLAICSLASAVGSDQPNWDRSTPWRIERVLV